MFLREAGILNCGVSQWPILGPVLILTCINDLLQSLSESGSYFYADDARIFHQDKGVQKIEDVLNKELSTLCKWFVDIKLSVRLGKIKQSIFSF